MLQEINLYNQLPQKKEFFLTFKNTILLYGAFIGLLLLLHLIHLWNENSLNTELSMLNNELLLTKQQLIGLTKEYPIIDMNLLKKDILRIENDYRDKAKELELLSPYANFSDYLIALGDAIVPGVWLTEIRFNRKSPHLELKGYTVRPFLLENFFVRLTSLPSYSHLKFKVNEIKQTSFPASFYISATQDTL